MKSITSTTRGKSSLSAISQSSICLLQRRQRLSQHVCPIARQPGDNLSALTSLTASGAMRPNNLASDLRPQGNASAKVKVCSLPCGCNCSLMNFSALLRMQRREISSRRMHALFNLLRSTSSMQRSCLAVSKLHGKLWLQPCMKRWRNDTWALERRYKRSIPQKWTSDICP